MKKPFVLWQHSGSSAKLVGFFESAAAAEAARQPEATAQGRFEVTTLQPPEGRGPTFRPSFAGLVSWMPLAAFAVLFAFPLLATLQTGHWPRYSQPDPKTLAPPWVVHAALLAIPIGLTTAFVGMLWLICEPKAWRRWHLAAYGMGVALWYFNLGNVGGLTVWLLD